MAPTARNLIIKLSLFLPILLFVICLNYIIDPSHIFTWGEYEKGIARLLLAGKNVAGVGNCDDRLLQKLYIHGLQSNKDIIILGSSRSMHIRSNLFPGKLFFNNSVSQATLNDHIAIYGMYREKALLPGKVILCLDDWIFSTNKDLDNWKTIQGEYISTRNIFLPTQEKESTIDKYSFKLKKYYQLFSPQYFHVSFFDMVNGNRYAFYATDKPFTETMSSKLSDGSLNYNKSVRQRTVPQATAIATTAAAKISKDEPIYNLSPTIREKFEAFINLILSDEVEVVFFLPPYHPKFFEQFSRATDRLDKVERYVQSVAEHKKIKVLGSYDPVKAACKEEDFYDEGHLRDSGINEIFSNSKTALNSVSWIND